MHRRCLNDVVRGIIGMGAGIDIGDTGSGGGNGPVGGGVGGTSNAGGQAGGMACP